MTEARVEQPAVARTAIALAALSVASSVLGLLRDLSLAGLFGASPATDAFLVAWTVPETATPLLMEGAMAYALVPVFARELEFRGSLTAVVSRTWLPLVAVLGTASALLVALAPQVVDLLTPGLADPDLAVRCLRVAAPTLLLLGVSGYLMAGLRTSGVFRLPASIYVTYNVGILACLLALHRRLGILSAAIGLSVGAALMVAVQLPAFLRRVGRSRPSASLSALRLFLPFVPIAGYTLGRQSQVFAERILGSTLHSGSISQLNYASKIAQVPMLLSLTVATVTFPTLARIATRGHTGELAAAIRRDLRVVALLILPAAVIMVVLAPQCVSLMFERGAFTAQDTMATAAVMRVYALGLLGQSLTGVAALAAFSAGRINWAPARAAAACITVTVLVDLAAIPSVGVRGLAAGNAVGITVLAVLVVRGVAASVPELALRDVLADVLRAVLAAGIALVAGVAVLPVASLLPVVLQVVAVSAVIMISYVLAAAVVLPSGEAAGMLATALRRIVPTAGSVPWSLMYHSVSDPTNDPLIVCVSPERLNQQLQWLRRHGLRGVRLDELHRAIRAGTENGLVGLSFDDGYADFLTTAVPLLERHGCTATVFAVADRLGGTNDWDSGLVRPLMDAADLREVAARGFEVGSHGATHRDLRGLTAEQLHTEVARAKASLEAVIGQPVVGFCYPYGHLDGGAVRAVEAAGYEYGAAVGWPQSPSHLALPRVFVGEQDAGLRLTAKRLLFWWNARRGLVTG